MKEKKGKLITSLKESLGEKFKAITEESA